MRVRVRVCVCVCVCERERERERGRERERENEKISFFTDCHIFRCITMEYISVYGGRKKSS